MTYLERLFKDHPNFSAVNMVELCPWDYDYEHSIRCPRYENRRLMSCDDCWNRKIPVEHWIPVDGTTGVCPSCHKQDHIDPLAKYCRYCGARLEVEE